MAEKQRRFGSQPQLPTERDLSREAVRARCASSLMAFVREAWHVLEPERPFIHGWHLDAIALHLEAITRGVFLKMGLQNRLRINVPPGTMKSLMSSVFWPAWEWGPADLPHLRYFTTSYSETYALRDSRKMRDLVSSDWYQEHWGDTVRLNRDGERSFSNTATGSRDAQPFVSLTSGRGDRVIVDDPHSTETAESDAERSRSLRVMRESVTSRLNDAATSAILVIMQRLHQQDISGLIDELGMGYINLILPMEFEVDRRCVTPIWRDPRTYEGELLFPERFPREVVERDKIPLGAYAVAGQLQQRPAPRSGGMFQRHWFNIVPTAPALVRPVRGWDLAASETVDAAWTAGVKMDISREGRVVIHDAVRDRLSPAKVERLIFNTAQTDGHSCRISAPQDPGQAGKAQVAAYARMLHGFNVRFSPETGSKEDRAAPLSAQAEAGNVDIVAGSWNKEFIDELCMFPNSRYKDLTDAASRAYAELIQAPKPRPPVQVPVYVRPS